MLFNNNISVGACPWCTIEGVRVGKTTAYPGALALVGPESPARYLWRTYTPGLPVIDEDESADEDEDHTTGKQAAKYNAHVDALITKGIRLRTTAEALASGKRSLRLATKNLKKKEPFMGVSVYEKLFPGNAKTPSHTRT